MYPSHRPPDPADGLTALADTVPPAAPAAATGAEGGGGSAAAAAAGGGGGGESVPAAATAVGSRSSAPAPSAAAGGSGGGCELSPLVPFCKPALTGTTAGVPSTAAAAASASGDGTEAGDAVCWYDAASCAAANSSSGLLLLPHCLLLLSLFGSAVSWLIATKISKMAHIWFLRHIMAEAVLQNRTGVVTSQASKTIATPTEVNARFSTSKLHRFVY